MWIAINVGRLYLLRVGHRCHDAGLHHVGVGASLSLDGASHGLGICGEGTWEQTGGVLIEGLEGGIEIRRINESGCFGEFLGLPEVEFFGSHHVVTFNG